jgi:hypothetical protein
LIHNNTVFNQGKYGIWNLHESSALIYDNEVFNNTLVGLVARENSTPTMMNNLIYSQNIGIGNIHNAVPYISKNVIRDNEDGIQISNYSAASIIDNDIYNNSKNGIYGNIIGTLLVENNSVAGNGVNGIMIISSGDEAIDVVNNTVNENLDTGIFISATGLANLTGNLVADNLETGIECVDGNFNLENNDLMNNGVAELQIRSSYLNGTGNNLNASEERGGVGVEITTSVVHLENSTIQDSDFGVTLEYSDVIFTNCSITNTDTDVEFMVNSQMWAINTTHDEVDIRFDKNDISSKFWAMWFLDVAVVDSMERPLSQANLYIPFEGKNWTLDTSGCAQWIPLTEYVKTKDGGREDIVHTFDINTTQPVTDGLTYENITVSSNSHMDLVFDFVPVISDMGPYTVTEDIELVKPLSDIVSDADHNLTDLEFNFSSPNVTASNGELLFQFDQEVLNDKETITMTVSDGNRSSSAEFVVYVNPVNDAPEILPIPTVEVLEDEMYILNMSLFVSDEEGDMLYIEVLSDYIEVNGLDLILLYPQEVVNETVAFMVTDGINEVSGEFLVNVTTVNDPPTVDDIPTITVTEDVTVRFNLEPYLSDVDNSMIGLSVIMDNHTHVTVDGLFLVFNYPDGILEDEIRIGVTDGNDTVWANLTIIVTPVDDPPSIMPIPDLKVIIGESFTIDLTFYITDEDTDLEDLSIETTSKYVTITDLIITIEYPEDFDKKEDRLFITIDDGTSKVTADINVTIIGGEAEIPTEIGLIYVLLMLMVVLMTAVGFYTYLFLRYGRYVVKEVFLVNEDGRLLDHRGHTTELDEDLFSGMLTAVQDFSQETFKSVKAGKVTEFRYEHFKIVLERGERIFLAAFVEGNVPSSLKNKMKLIIEGIEGEHGEDIANWDGESSHLPKFDKYLEDLVSDIDEDEDDVKSRPGS